MSLQQTINQLPKFDLYKFIPSKPNENIELSLQFHIKSISV